MLVSILQSNMSVLQKVEITLHSFSFVVLWYKPGEFLACLIGDVHVHGHSDHHTTLTLFAETDGRISYKCSESSCQAPKEAMEMKWSLRHDLNKASRQYGPGSERKKTSTSLQVHTQGFDRTKRGKLTNSGVRCS